MLPFREKAARQSKVNQASRGLSAIADLLVVFSMSVCFCVNGLCIREMTLHYQY